MEKSSFMESVGTEKLDSGFLWPTAKAQGFIVGPTLLPGNGSSPWLPLGTQPKRADSTSLGYASTLGLLGTAVVGMKKQPAPRNYPTPLPPRLGSMIFKSEMS